MVTNSGSLGSKLARMRLRIRGEGIGGLVHWAGRWVYWNTYLFQLRPSLLRQQYKYLKPFKKYGIANPIIIYQMGKVGSSTILASLEALDLDVPLIHAHYLNDLDELEKNTRLTFPYPDEALGQLRKGRAIRKQIDNDPATTWNLVSLVRRPIARDVSAFFQTLDSFVPDLRDRVSHGTISIDELAEVFVQEQYHHADDYWFDFQVKPLFGIDVYAEKFPVERGYKIFEGKKARLLVIRLEDLDSRGSIAMQEFLGLRNFVLIRTNVGEEKTYASLYRRFLTEASLPTEYLDDMIGSRYANHFYTRSELEQDKAAWFRA